MEWANAALDRWLPPAKPTLIGLYAPAAQSGKSEVAKVLMEEFGFVTVKFAGPLKDMARGLLRSMGIEPEIVEEMVEGSLKEEVIPGFDAVTTRMIMQTLGTDWGREAVDKDLWTKVAAEAIRKWHRAGTSVVVDDLRFPNEFVTLKAMGATCVRIERPQAFLNPVGSSRYEALLEHIEMDRKILNTGTIEYLRECARTLVS